ncbi:hypothetical protein OG948_21630 [Embleya sp. NBC_00888]|nr:hypothetical protein OG948_21630 [Embleya sp. NBC_00888]
MITNVRFPSSRASSSGSGLGNPAHHRDPTGNATPYPMPAGCPSRARATTTANPAMARCLAHGPAIQAATLSAVSL